MSALPSITRRTTRLSLIAILVASGLYAPIASAQSGALDPSFGDGGVVVVDSGIVSDVAVLPGGELVAVGRFAEDAAAWRLRSDGTPDLSFGDQGVARFGGGRFLGVAPHPSDGVAAVVRSGSSCPSWSVRRILGDGSPGEAWVFGYSGGLEGCDYGAFFSYDNSSVWVQEDERVVVAGTISFAFGSEGTCYALRYLPEGTPDASFGEDGGAFVDVDSGDWQDPWTSCRAAALDDSGWVVFATEGGPPNSGTERWGGLRLLADGTLDPSFEPVVEVQALDRVRGVTVAPEGSVTLGGVNDEGETTLVRLTEQGALDANFGEGGVASFPELGEVAISALASQPDGKLLVLGRVGMFDPSSLVARVLPNGSLDSSFGADGVASLFDSAWNMTLDADGRIVVAGSFYDPEGELTASYVIRLMNDLTVENEPSGQPERLTLSTPAPNPASAQTTLTYTLAELSTVRLALYDILGREVAVVVEGTKPAGQHEAALDASRLAPGLYVARLTAGGEVVARRLTVVR